MDNRREGTNRHTTLMTTGQAQHDPVRVVVIGEAGTGKTTLITTAQSGEFREGPPGMLRGAIHLPPEITLYDSPVEVSDTRCCTENPREWVKKVERSQAVLVTFACDRPESFRQVVDYTLPMLEEVRFKHLTIVLVGCKRDKIHPDFLDDSFSVSCKLLLKKFTMVDTCLFCSVFDFQSVRFAFHRALRGVLYPLAPLVHESVSTLSPALVRALTRIFSESVEERVTTSRTYQQVEGKIYKATMSCNDHNHHIQVRLGCPPLASKEFDDIKHLITNLMPSGVVRGNITYYGFLFLHQVYLQNGRYELVWKLVRAFGYSPILKQLPQRHQKEFSFNQRVELSSLAVQFLESVFRCFEPDKNQVISAVNADHLFSSELESHIECRKEIGIAASGGLSLDIFLSMWELMALRDPSKTFAALIDLGYLGPAKSAFCKVNIEDLCKRNVVQCFVFGDYKTGQSALLNCLLGRPFSELPTSTTTERFAAKVVEQSGPTKKTLVLREIEDGVARLLDRESLAGCDVAIFVYKSNDISSQKKTVELYSDIVSQGENGIFGVIPCFFVGAKQDPDDIVADSVCMKFMEQEGCTWEFDFITGVDTDTLSRIIHAAGHPHEYIQGSASFS